jgi:drug/metabolite transporter (DMT)-like permease
MNITKGKGVLLLFVLALIWSLAPIFVRYLSLHLDQPTQNAYRYFFGGMPLLICSLVFFREQMKSALTRWRWLVLAATLLTMYQALWVLAVYRVLPTACSLIIKISVFYSMVISFIAFPEERPVIKSLPYLGGTFLSLAGVIGVILFKKNLGDIEIQVGVILLFLAALCWNLYAAVVQKTLRAQNVMGYTPLLFLASSSVFFIWSSVRGDPLVIFKLSGKVLTAAVLSGLFCIGIAQTIYYAVLKSTGIAMASSLLLISPLLTGIISYIIFGEILTFGQIVSGAVLISGAFVVSRCRGIK